MSRPTAKSSLGLLKKTALSGCHAHKRRPIQIIF